MTNKIKDQIFLGLQILIFVAFVLPLDWGSYDLAKDYVILFRLFSFIGLSFTLLAIISFDYLISPFPSPKTKTKLKTNGVYRWSRHPIYSGLILFLFAWASSNGNYYQLFIAGVFLLFIYQKARYEEQLLIKKFKAYKQYKKQTRMFL